MSTTEAVRVSGRDGLLSTVPTMLGFHPTDSVVIVGLQAPRGRVVLTARVDTADYVANPGDMADQIAGAMSRNGADAVAVVIYGDVPDTDALHGVMAAHGVPVVRTEVTDNVPHAVGSLLAAETVAAGHVTHSSRDGLRALIEHVPTLDPTPETAALLGRMAGWQARDAFLAESVPSAADVLPQVLTACQTYPDPDGSRAPHYAVELAHLCAVAALLAYRTGNGALAQVAIDRALRIESGHRLSHLLLASIAAGLPPALLDAVTALDQP